MKKILAFFILSFFVSSAAYGHPPSDIKISYDSNTRMLRALIAHNVANVKSHFIKKVDVGLNEKEIIEHSISQQDNNTGQAVSYLIPDAKPGDTISVEAYCSVSGKLKKEIKVAK